LIVEPNLGCVCAEAGAILDQEVGFLFRGGGGGGREYREGIYSMKFISNFCKP
jgi:hypothetical protein